MAKSSLAAIIEALQLQQYFSSMADVRSDKHLIMHIAQVLPDASVSVRSLLPDVKWLSAPPVSVAAAAKHSTSSAQTVPLRSAPTNSSNPVPGDQASGQSMKSDLLTGSSMKLALDTTGNEVGQSASQSLTVRPFYVCMPGNVAKAGKSSSFCAKSLDLASNNTKWQC